jgi:ribonuclease Z
MSDSNNHREPSTEHRPRQDDGRKCDSRGLSRRDALKLAGTALGGLAAGELAGGLALADTLCQLEEGACCPQRLTSPCQFNDLAATRRYSYFDQLPAFRPFRRAEPSDGQGGMSQGSTIAPLGEDQMRVSFLGSSVPPPTGTQAMMSIFVEVGWDPIRQMPLDQFVFDCGSGVVANYGALNIGYGRMNKIFLTHLHGDHMSDLTHIYCFGPSGDRKSPLFVWGPGPSGLRNPAYPERSPHEYFDDGTNAFCRHLREACRWHSESFSFQTTSYQAYQQDKPTQERWGLPWEPRPVSDDADDDAYAMIPMELTLERYRQGEDVAYHNLATGVKITYFPVIHARVGSIGYKLEWTVPGSGAVRTLIYTGDTKPETISRDQAINGGAGVDVFIHEMAVPPQVWATMGARSKVLLPADSAGVTEAARIQNSSHSPQGAFGYLLSTISPRPRLTVATHFPTSDATVACALQSLQQHCPVYQNNHFPFGADPNIARVTWSFDRLVITVAEEGILEQRAVVDEFSGFATFQAPPGTSMDGTGYNPPKYACIDSDSGQTVGDPYAQIDQSTAIPPCAADGECRYNPDGY